MKVTKQETLYHKDHGATMKHKCGKRIVALSLFLGAFSFFGLSFFIYIPHLGQCSKKWWSSHFYLFITQWLQLDTRTKVWLYMNASGGVPGYAMNQEWHEWKNYEWWLCHKYDVNYMIMQSNMTMMGRVIVNGTVESCMAIYLGMAMEMPW